MTEGMPAFSRDGMHALFGVEVQSNLGVQHESSNITPGPHPMAPCECRLWWAQ
jgi:hypothetical protein